MRRLLQVCGPLLECDGFFGWLDTTLLCLGVGFTVGTAVPMLRARIGRWEGRRRPARYSKPQEKTAVGVTSTITESDASIAASSEYCRYFS